MDKALIQFTASRLAPAGRMACEVFEQAVRLWDRLSPGLTLPAHGMDFARWLPVKAGGAGAREDRGDRRRRMNSASMATNLLGRSVRLRERPVSCSTAEGSIALISIDDRGTHFLVLVDGQLISVESAEAFRVLD
jgi:hypothetical protein